MLKKYDGFLDIACYCLKINADFAQFQNDCVKLKGWNNTFVIKSTSLTSDVSSFHVSYVVCCKKFSDFQIGLFLETELLPLRTVDCRYSWARTDVGLDYRTDGFLEIYYNSDSGDDSDNDEQINCFGSFVCYTEMRGNLVLERFCQKIQSAIFYDIFYEKFFAYYFKLFLFLLRKILRSIKVCSCFFDVGVYFK